MRIFHFFSLLSAGLAVAASTFEAPLVDLPSVPADRIYSDRFIVVLQTFELDRHFDTIGSNLTTTSSTNLTWLLYWVIQLILTERNWLWCAATRRSSTLSQSTSCCKMTTSHEMGQ